MRTVKNIIDTKPQPSNIISPTAMVIDALTMMNSVNLSYLIVMEDEEVKGLFSERDYSRNVVLKGRSSSSSKVEDVMATDLPTVSPADTVEQCMNTMIRHKSRYLLAFDGAKFLGVITIHDLLREVIANKEGVFDGPAQALLDSDESHFVY